MRERLNEIHRRFRLAMNGVVSSSMRGKGMPYKINFGLSLPLLKQIAGLYRPDAVLAGALWKEDIRESRLLATFLQPHDSFSKEEAVQWLEEADTPELVDFLCMNLLQHLPYASEMALFFVKKNDEQNKRKGYVLSGRLFAVRGKLPEEQADDLLKAGMSDLSSENHSLSMSVFEMLKKAVRNKNRAQKILSLVDTSDTIGEELLSEYDYYCRELSDMED